MKSLSTERAAITANASVCLLVYGRFFGVERPADLTLGHGARTELPSAVKSS